MMIMVLIGGVGLICILSSGAGVLAYTQDWLCDSLGEDFGMNCNKDDDDDDDDDDDEEEEEEDKDKDKDKDKDDDDDKNDSKKRLLKAYDRIFDDKGAAKSGAKSWFTFYKDGCKKAVWRENSDNNMMRLLKDSESCGGNAWRLKGEYNEYNLYVHKKNSNDPFKLNGSFGFYDVKSNGMFKLKNKSKDKWLKLKTCKGGQKLSYESSKSKGSWFIMNDGCT